MVEDICPKCGCKVQRLGQFDEIVCGSCNFGPPFKTSDGDAMVLTEEKSVKEDTYKRK